MYGVVLGDISTEDSDDCGSLCDNAEEGIDPSSVGRAGRAVCGCVHRPDAAGKPTQEEAGSRTEPNGWSHRRGDCLCHVGLRRRVL